MWLEEGRLLGARVASLTLYTILRRRVQKVDALHQPCALQSSLALQCKGLPPVEVVLQGASLCGCEATKGGIGADVVQGIDNEGAARHQRGGSIDLAHCVGKAVHL